MPQADDNTQVDERIWQAWLQKNEVQDKIRFARRVRAIELFSVFAALIALLWRFAK